MNTISKTYRLQEVTINQIKRLSNYYNKSATEILSIAVGNLYCEMPDIEPKSFSLLDMLKENIKQKYNESLTNYAARNGFTVGEIYRTITSIEENKNIRGFGSEDRQNKMRDNKDEFYSTVTAQIAMLLFEDFGIEFNV